MYGDFQEKRGLHELFNVYRPVIASVIVHIACWDPREKRMES